MRAPLPLLVVTALCVSIVLAVTPAPARAYQHISNGTFEDGLSGWSATPGTHLELESGNSYEGVRSAAIVFGGTGTGGMRSLLEGSLGPGTYAISLRATADAGSGSIRAMLVLHSESGTSYADTGSLSIVPGAWAHLAGDLNVDQASAAAIVIEVVGESGSRILVDAVSLDGAAPVQPQPSSTPSPLASVADATPSPAVTASVTASPSPSPTGTPILDVIGPSLRNPGFEELDGGGLPFAWQKYGGTLTSSSRSRAGARAAQLTSETSSTKWLHQAVTVEPGRWYEFSAWILQDAAAVSSASVRLAWYASVDASGSQIATDDALEPLETPSASYRLVSTGSVQAPPDARSARVRVLLSPRSGALASITVDDAWFGDAAPPLPAPTPPASLTALEPPAEAAGLAPATRRQDVRRASQALAERSRSSSGDVVISEVLYDASGDAPDSDAEWVELYNRSDVAVDLGGWSLADGLAVDQLPSTVVPPHGYAIVAATDAFVAQYPDVAPAFVLGGRIGNGLGNEGDVLVLIDPAGRFADAVSWGENSAAFTPPVDDVPEGHSIERLVPGVDSDAATDWTDNHRPTPGGPYIAPANGALSRERATIDVVESSPAGTFGWLPWIVAGVSLAALAGAAGWRALEMARTRTQP